jgi:Icc-related predicted phosphoesterase
MKKVMLIGDVHGDMNKYHRYTYRKKNQCDMSIALGDFGFKQEYDWFQKHAKDNAYILPGNHDYYTLINSDECPPNILRKFGYIEELDLFYVSGAFSIDRVYRTEGKDWFADEEMSISELYNMIDLYEKVKPKTVISHTLPLEVIKIILHYKVDYPSRTSQAMSSMISIHEPLNWYCGHFHESTKIKYKNINFQVLDELEIIFINLPQEK